MTRVAQKRESSRLSELSGECAQALRGDVRHTLATRSTQARAADDSFLLLLPSGDMGLSYRFHIDEELGVAEEW